MKINKILLYLIISLQLISCDSVKKGIGIDKSIPDEFLVEKKQKNIALPPDYNLYPPDSKQINSDSDKVESLKLILKKEIKKNDYSSSDDQISQSNSQKTKVEKSILDKLN